MPTFEEEEKPPLRERVKEFFLGKQPKSILALERQKSSLELERRKKQRAMDAAIRNIISKYDVESGHASRAVKHVVLKGVKLKLLEEEAAPLARVMELAWSNGLASTAEEAEVALRYHKGNEAKAAMLVKEMRKRPGDTSDIKARNTHLEMEKRKLARL